MLGDSNRFVVNPNHNHEMKEIFKGAAARVPMSLREVLRASCDRGPAVRGARRTNEIFGEGLLEIDRDRTCKPKTRAR